MTRVGCSPIWPLWSLTVPTACRASGSWPITGAIRSGRVDEHYMAADRCGHRRRSISLTVDGGRTETV